MYGLSSGGPAMSDELGSLRSLLAALEAGELTIAHKGFDVTQREIAILKREIAVLEGVLARLKSASARANGERSAAPT
jgi:hypothetical protein